MKKLFRDHRELLDESLETTIEVNSAQDIIDHINSRGILKINRIEVEEPTKDDRLPKEWGGIEHYVIGYWDSGYGLVGMSNFCE